MTAKHTPKNDERHRAKMHEIVRIGKIAVQKAQEESRRIGVPNVYEINGVLMWELPN